MDNGYMDIFPTNFYLRQFRYHPQKIVGFLAGPDGSAQTAGAARIVPPEPDHDALALGQISVELEGSLVGWQATAFIQHLKQAKIGVVPTLDLTNARNLGEAVEQAPLLLL